MELDDIIVQRRNRRVPMDFQGEIGIEVFFDARSHSSMVPGPLSLVYSCSLISSLFVALQTSLVAGSQDV